MVDRDAHAPELAGARATRTRRAPVRAPAIVLAGALLIAAPQATLAAAALLGGNCEAVARDLRSIQIPVETLTIDIVDHMSEDHGAVDPVVGHEQDPTAPLLFLTPRVAHILQDVFGDAEMPTEQVRQVMLAANDAAEAETPAAPDASGGGSNGREKAVTDFDPADPAIVSGPLTETFFDADTLPRFQRQMYRNDI